MFSCKSCGGEYCPPFIWMSDEQWKKIGCEPTDFICHSCLLGMIGTKLGWVGYLVFGAGKHDLKRCKTKVNVSLNHGRVNRDDKALAG